MPSDTAIRRIDVFGVGIPLIHPFKTVAGIEDAQRSVVLRIAAADGTVGIGNVDPSPGYSTETVEQTLETIAACLAPAVIGRDATNIRQILAAMDEAVLEFFEAKAAVEMACVDLAARRMGVAVHTWLGGALRQQVTFNAWIGMVGAEVAGAEARSWQDAGFCSAKIKVGGDVMADADRVTAVRRAVGPGFRLRIDANAGYDTSSAIRLVHLLAGAGLELFEQPGPADDLAGLAAVRREAARFGLPVMADESVVDHASLIDIIKAEAADLVKLKVMKQGGLLKTAQMIATAEAAGLCCVVGHGFGLAVNTLAEIMLAATARNVIDGLECVGPLKTSDDILPARLDLSRGTLAVPDGPGFGAVLDETRLQRYGFFAETCT